MSKYVKDLIGGHYHKRLEDVSDALIVNVIGLDVNQSVVLRKRLREKNIKLFVVKNSLAKRATEGTPLAPAFEGLEGAAAVVWGGDDFVSLVKEIVQLHNDGDYEAFKARGGVMEGVVLTTDRVKEISTWPSHGEQLSILSGQILSPAANLAACLKGPGGMLASQVKKKSKSEDQE